MKNITIILGSILTIGLFIVSGSAIAEQRVKIFEMGESGQTVEFPMSSEEIAAEDAEKERLAALQEAKLKKPKKRMQIIEMGESGQTVEFHMTPEEIAVEDAENERLSEVREAKLEMPQKCMEEYELAESGIIIEFPSFEC